MERRGGEVSVSVGRVGGRQKVDSQLIVRYLYDGNDNTVAGISLILTCSL